ncbi:galactokinase [Flagellimonas sp. CMM7]|uniref:galactokinase n=1 Tax=Flagellimonas sp. CMM7 TaxID=2654676 RepID=UPI001F444E60|nr:galactokinase [Flagellimonas sp. CMM7]UII80378.1 galactokinase [Flagellimonas sp. CMM7]
MEKEIKVASPGRINLLGEHVDYNDGFVLPAAIDKCIYLSLKANGSNNRCTIKSRGFDSILVANLNALGQGTEGWHNYVLGVLSEISQISDNLKGFDCEIESKVPVGSGVSSSAALECGLAFGLNELFNLGLDKWQLIKLSQRAEHNFVGTKCGIMDQFASVMGKERHLMFLDCTSLGFKYIPVQIEPYRLLLINTNVSHNLATGEYNVRRKQCEDGLAIVHKKLGIEKSFRNVTMDMLDASKKLLGKTLYNRCSYVVEENARVLQAVEALNKNDLTQLGRLMYQTHEGLSTKYDVSCPELDFLVNFSKDENDVLGARMMGGGFGGCTINIIHNDKIDAFVRQLSVAYEEEFNIKLSYFQTVPSKGTSIMKME